MLAILFCYESPQLSTARSSIQWSSSCQSCTDLQQSWQPTSWLTILYKYISCPIPYIGKQIWLNIFSLISIPSGVAWVMLKVGPAGGGSKNFIWGGHGECGKVRKGPTFENFSGELTSRSLLLDTMSIIRSAFMAVCWLDKSAITSKGRFMAWPGPMDATPLSIPMSVALFINKSWLHSDVTL